MLISVEYDDDALTFRSGRVVQVRFFFFYKEQPGSCRGWHFSGVANNFPEIHASISLTPSSIKPFSCGLLD